MKVALVEKLDMAATPRKDLNFDWFHERQIWGLKGVWFIGPFTLVRYCVRGRFAEERDAYRLVEIHPRKKAPYVVTHWRLLWGRP